MNFFSLLSSRHLVSIFVHVAFWAVLLAKGFGGEVEEVEVPYFTVDGAVAGLDLLPLKGVEASIEIVGTLAQVELVQTYANVGERAIEAVYVFPGSTRAAVSGLEMRVGDRVVEALIQRKATARRKYEEAKEEGRTASLLEQHRPNVFQMNLANILPGDVVEVTLRYTEWVQREKEEYTFTLPLVVGPRGGEGGQVRVANPFLGESVRYDVWGRVRAAASLEEVSCVSHDLEVAFDDARTASLRLNGDASSVGNRDFVMRYRISGDVVKSGVWVSESNGEKYFMATLEPPVLKADRARLAREYFFVVDVSGSMSGFPLNTAKEMMGALVARLNAEDRFNVLLFAGESEVFAPESVAATEENLLEAVRFLFGTRGSGGTRLLPALERVYGMERDGLFSRNIVVLTDGYISVEEEVFDLIRERLDEASVFACGIGSSPNRHLIEGMAKVGQGEPFFVMDASESESVANRFSEYVSEPVLSQVSVEFEGMQVYDVEPVSLPDLLAERPVVVFGKYGGEKAGRIVLSGRSGEGDYVEAIDLAAAVDLAGSRSLELVWARERIRRESDYAGLWSSGERVKAITELGLKHSLLTKYTSFLAVDRVVRSDGIEGSELVRQAVSLPEGMGILGSGSSVPVTPEPEMWALMGLVLVAVSWILVRRGI